MVVVFVKIMAQLTAQIIPTLPFLASTGDKGDHPPSSLNGVRTALCLCPFRDLICPDAQVNTEGDDGDHAIEPGEYEYPPDMPFLHDHLEEGLAAILTGCPKLEELCLWCVLKPSTIRPPSLKPSPVLQRPRKLNRGKSRAANLTRCPPPPTSASSHFHSPTHMCMSMRRGPRHAIPFITVLLQHSLSGISAHCCTVSAPGTCA